MKSKKKKKNFSKFSPFFIVFKHSPIKKHQDNKGKITRIINNDWCHQCKREKKRSISKKKTLSLSRIEDDLEKKKNFL